MRPCHFHISFQPCGAHDLVHRLVDEFLSVGENKGALGLVVGGEGGEQNGLAAVVVNGEGAVEIKVVTMQRETEVVAFAHWLHGETGDEDTLDLPAS